MAEDPRAPAPTPQLDVDAIAGRSFTKGRRGFDTDEVRAHLLAVAEHVRALQAQIAQLEQRLRTAEAAASAAPAELDTHVVAKLLGEETARVLETARAAADEMRAKAEEQRDQLLREATGSAEAMRAEAKEYAERTRADADEEAAATRTGADTYANELRRTTEEAAAALRAQTEADTAELREAAQHDAAVARSDAEEHATRVRAEADEEARARRDAAAAAAEAERAEADADAARRRADADEYATRVRGDADQVMAVRAAEAEAEAERIRQTAELERDALLSRAGAELEAAQERGRELVEEAQRGREQVLGDLARKRRAAATQLEQLQAARERILDAYALVRESVDAATGQLGEMLPAAKRAADEAVRRAEQRPLQTIEELEAELVRNHREPAAAEGEQLGVEPGASPGDRVAAEPSAGSALADNEDGDPVPAEAGVDAESEPVVEPGPPPAALVETTTAGSRTGATTATTATKDRGRGRRRRHHERKDPALAELDTGELPAVEPSAEFEEVRLLAPVVPATAQPEAAPGEAVPGEVVEPRAEPDEVQDIFARLRASRDEPSELAEPGEAPSAAAAHVEPDSALDPVPGASDVGEASAAEAPQVADLPEEQRAASGERDAEAELLALLEARDAALTPVEAALSKQLKRALSDEQSRILDALRTAKSQPALDALVGGASEQHDRYAAVATDQLGRAWAAGGAFATRQDPDAAPAPAGEEVQAAAVDLAATMVDLLRTRLERCLAEDSEAATSGDPTAELELADRVRACYREWRSQRLAELVADAAITAFTAGQFAAFGSECHLQWQLDPSGSPCPDAEDNALAGVVVKGTAFPTGHVCPPAHPGCRCLLMPAPPASSVG